MLDVKGIFLTLGVAVLVIGAIAVGLVNMGSSIYTGYANETGSRLYLTAQALNSGAGGFTTFITTWVPLILTFVGIGLAIFYLVAFTGGGGKR